MAKRPVHWYEGMFLKPHHFQALDRYQRERVGESEDWLHPHDWGLRSVRFDEDAIANHAMRLISCQARFRDGTTLNIPEEGSVDPLDLKAALARSPEVMIYLAVPAWQEGRGNVERTRSDQNPRYMVGALEVPDENSGADRQEIEFRYIQPRLVLSDPELPPGFEVLPIARVVLTAAAGAPPQLDRSYVPPILGLDAWAPLHDEVQKLYQHIDAWINQEADQLVGRKVAFDSQVLGDAEKILRLSTLNAASAALQAVLYTRGLHPLLMYQELARLMGQLSIFGDTRRPIKVPTYDHDDIGLIYTTVMDEIRRLLGRPKEAPFEKRYFQVVGKRLVVQLDADWTLETTRLYVGVETSELSDAECDELIRVEWDFKLGSAEEVETIFKQAMPGLTMEPLNRIPPALPTGFVYFDIVRNPTYWKDVVRTSTLGLRFRTSGARVIGNQVITLTRASTGRTHNLQFAVFAVKGR